MRISAVIARFGTIAVPLCLEAQIRLLSPLHGRFATIFPLRARKSRSDDCQLLSIDGPDMASQPALTFFLLLLVGLFAPSGAAAIGQGQNQAVVRYEYDFGFGPDAVLVKNLSSGLSFILNKSAIRQHLAIGGALVVEKLVFFFPDEEMTRQALGISRPAR